MKKKYIVITLIMAAAHLCATGSAAWQIGGESEDGVTVPCITTF